MENFLRTRIKARLNDLGINPFELARNIGAERTFINDLLVGKKQTIRHKMVPAIASALDCDPEFLMGAQPYPRVATSAAASDGMPVAGVCEENAWRAAKNSPSPVHIPVSRDPRFPALHQSAFLVRGDHASGMGVFDGDVVVAVSGEPLRDGDAVVARRSRPSGEAEVSIRIVSNGLLLTRPSSGEAKSVNASDAEILGRIILAIKIF